MVVNARWDETRPGYTELDLVAHCGNSAVGDFVATLNVTDLATGWSEVEAVLGIGSKELAEAISRYHPSARYVGSLQSAADYVAAHTKAGEVVVTMGANEPQFIFSGSRIRVRDDSFSTVSSY